MQTIGKYEIIEEIGQGGFGTVYRAADPRMRREVALKVIRPVHANAPAVVARFEQEVATAAQLHHPNIVTVFDFGTADGQLYLAMRLVDGPSLKQVLDERETLPLPEAIAILGQIAAALDHLHERDIVHRDLKPANVLLEGSPYKVTLTDFGLVRSLEASVQLSQSGSIVGTPAYMAPEQASPEQWGEVSAQTDVYALGVLVYRMLLGRLPFETEDQASLLHAHAYEEPTVPLEWIPQLGDALVEILLKALAKPPGERYPSAGALVGALQALQDQQAQQAAEQTELAGLLAMAQAARTAGDWQQVLDCCVQMLRIDQGHPDILPLMAEAQEAIRQANAAEVARRRRIERYEAGEQAMAAKDWAAAIAAFEAVVAENPDFREVQQLLTTCQTEQKWARWYEQAQSHTTAKEWRDACRVWVDLLREAPNYRQGERVPLLVEAIAGLLAERQLLPEPASSIPTPGAESASPIPPAIPMPSFNTKQDVRIWEKDGKEMVRIPAGEFLYGNNKETKSLPEFWIDKTPVTNAEYARFVADTGQEPPEHWQGKTPPDEIANHPVVYVTWHDAVAYAEWAGKRLPTEEEWEKAARGTDGRTYPWGDETPTRELCNFDQNEKGTTPVGKYSPQGDSPYGCVDMAGNVWDWTASNYSKERRVLRGGSWYTYATFLRAASRFFVVPTVRDLYFFGFRCALPPGQ